MTVRDREGRPSFNPASTSLDLRPQYTATVFKRAFEDHGSPDTRASNEPGAALALGGGVRSEDREQKRNRRTFSAEFKRDAVRLMQERRGSGRAAHAGRSASRRYAAAFQLRICMGDAQSASTGASAELTKSNRCTASKPGGATPSKSDHLMQISSAGVPCGSFQERRCHRAIGPAV